MKFQWIEILVYPAYLGFFILGIILGLHNTLSYIALCLSLICAVFWFIARWQLGDAFSVRAQAHHLVTQGLYSKIRHPIYIFGTPAFLFIVLALQGWPALLIWVVVILIQVKRLRREERFLIDMFGEEYVEYQNRTWF